ncbi:sugar phosphate isomerase/epimerase family protein [Gaetbulibacter aestuarii]|uniref:Sugar phosphate isomerase/epimerase family protein n=1 Tax=Gaetbulibacter aestuarii TaxID=1502358 RepID=A0ABW7N045_9FLAO
MTKLNALPGLSGFIVLSLILSLTSCKQKTEQSENTESMTESTMTNQDPFFKLSLAEWSLHRTFNAKNGDPFQFAKIARENGFEGLEYVSQLYSKQIEKLGFDTVIDSLKTMSEKYGMQNVLIMVDHEGDLASPDEAVRDEAVENHKKWVDAAATLGCHAIRVNTFGTNDPEKWVPAVADGLKKLATYAATKNIEVLCENHGWLSSDAPILMKAIHEVNMDNCGTLPDFGNWCVKRKDGEQWGECVAEYPDKYQGIALMLPKATAVSAKSYDFDDNGNETTLDYPRILKLVKDAGYTSFIGVEYEGNRLSEMEGLLATKALLLKSAAEIK